VVQSDYFEFDVNIWLSEKEKEVKKKASCHALCCGGIVIRQQWQAVAKRAAKQEEKRQARSRVTIDLAGAAASMTVGLVTCCHGWQGGES